MSTRVCKQFRFEAAHRLLEYKGDCKNLHGHSYKVEVVLLGEQQTEGPCSGMVVDFSYIKDVLVGPYIKQLDHALICEVHDNGYAGKQCVIDMPPTAECIAWWLFGKIYDRLQRYLNMTLQTIDLYAVRVWETESSYAEATYF